MKISAKIALFIFLPLVYALNLSASETVPTTDSNGAPLITKHVNPAYPVAARAAKIEGRVIVECLVAADGAVLAAASLSEVDPILCNAAVNAVKQWQFSSRAEITTEPVLVRVPVIFELHAPLTLDEAMIAKK